MNVFSVFNFQNHVAGKVNHGADIQEEVGIRRGTVSAQKITQTYQGKTTHRLIKVRQRITQTYQGKTTHYIDLSQYD